MVKRVRASLRGTSVFLLVAAMAGAAPGARAQGGPYWGFGAGASGADDAEHSSRTDAGASNAGGAIIIPGIVIIIPTLASSTPAEDIRYRSTHDRGFDARLELGYAFATGLRVDLSAGYRENGFDSLLLQQGFDTANGSTVTDVGGEVTASSALTGLWYDFREGSRLRPYLGLGTGGLRLRMRGPVIGGDPSIDDADTVLAYLGGAGLSYRTRSNRIWTLDYRYLQAEDAVFETESNPQTTTWSTHLLTAGMRFHRAPVETDDDGDGVGNPRDRCPGTPAGVPVDAKGCPQDSDSDGVDDGGDACPGTPRGQPVDFQGCPVAADSDRDGVPDSVDQCPDTPFGVTVDARGCPLSSGDADQDGVPDAVDRCPDTTIGMFVDDYGCPLDSDGDGVPDGLDQCPDTPRGVAVMSNGCEPSRSVVLEGVKFRQNSSYLTPSAISRLEQETLRILQESPGFMVEIQGHTCDLGDARYNEWLSQRRADRVRDFLIERGIPADRLVSTGYGEAQPMVPNSGEENREVNRRVELKVLDAPAR